MSYGLEELSSKFFDNVSVKHLERFHDVTTPEGNVLEGVICRAHNHYLGSLVITKVNGKDTCQFVQSMPKIHYPDEYAQIDISRLGISVYEKLDGTCIIMYPLLDETGGVIEVLCKTRGTVVADKHILDMAEQTKIRNYKQYMRRNPSRKLYFELYGLENLHTIRHNRIIDAELIAISDNNEFTVAHPMELSVRTLFKIVKINDVYEIVCTCNDDLRNYFSHSHIDCGSFSECCDVLAILLEEANNKYVRDYGYPALEGVVMQGYGRNMNHKFLKIKPKTIKSSCYESGKVPVNSIRKEILKLFDEYNLETIKEKTIEDNTWYLDIVNENLKEEFTIELIMDSQKRIKRLFQNIWEWKTPTKGDNDIAHDLVKKYPNLTIKDLMRKFSTEYPHKKARSSKIYQILTHLVRT